MQLQWQKWKPDYSSKLNACLREGFNLVIQATISEETQEVECQLLFSRRAHVFTHILSRPTVEETKDAAEDLMSFFDEALDALDDDNAAMFCRLMKKMSTDQCIVIITHKMFQNMEADQVFKL